MQAVEASTPYPSAHTVQTVAEEHSSQLDEHAPEQSVLKNLPSLHLSQLVAPPVQSSQSAMHSVHASEITDHPSLQAVSVATLSIAHVVACAPVQSDAQSVPDFPAGQESHVAAASIAHDAQAASQLLAQSVPVFPATQAVQEVRALQALQFASQASHSQLVVSSKVPVAQARVQVQVLAPVSIT